MRLLLFLIIVLIISCKNDIETVQNLTSRNNLPSESATNVEMIYSDSAKVKIKLVAPVLDRYSNKEDPYIELPKGVNIIFYDEYLKPKTRLTSRYAIRREKDTTMIVRNKVVVINEKGEKLETEELRWNENKKEIRSDAFVKITKEDRILMGQGLRADETFTQYEILKPNMEATIYLDDEKNVPDK